MRNKHCCNRTQSLKLLRKGNGEVSQPYLLLLNLGDLLHLGLFQLCLELCLLFRAQIAQKVTGRERAWWHPRDRPLFPAGADANEDGVVADLCTSP